MHRFVVFKKKIVILNFKKNTFNVVTLLAKTVDAKSRLLQFR